MSGSSGSRHTDPTDAELDTATLVHELRQPLFALKALAQLARSEGRDLGASDIRTLLELLEHVEHVLEEHGSADPQAPSLLDLNRTIREAVALVEPRCREVGARVELRLCDEPLTVRARPVALRRVVLNLLRNALDALEDVEAGRVVVQTRRSRGGARLEVHDTGAGIPKAVRPRVFEPFVTTKPPGRGTGLGLYVARRLVEEAAGELELECPEGGGTRARVQLPSADWAQFSDSSSEVA